MDSLFSLLLLVLCEWLVNGEILDSATTKPVEPWYPREFIFAPVEMISTPIYDRNNEQEEHVLSLKRTDMFIGRRRRRAVREPSPNALDDQAAAAIFGDEGKWDHKPKHSESPPAPPDPVLYNRQFAVTPSNIQRESQHRSDSEDDSSSPSNSHPKTPPGTSAHTAPIGIEQGPSPSEMKEKIQQRSESKSSKDASSSSTTTNPKIPLGIQQGRTDSELQDKIDQRPNSDHLFEKGAAHTSTQQEAKQSSSNSSFEVEREMPLSKIQSQAEHDMEQHNIPVGIEQGPTTSEMKKKIEQRPLPSPSDDHSSSSQQPEDHTAAPDPKVPLGIEKGPSHSEMLRKITERPSSQSPSDESSSSKQPESEEASKSGDHENQQGSSSNVEDKLQQRPLSPRPTGKLSSISIQPKIQSEPSRHSPPLDREQSPLTLQHKLQQKPSLTTPFDDSSAQNQQQLQISIDTRPGSERRPPLLKNKQKLQPISHQSDTDEEQRPYRPSMSLRTPLMSIDVQERQRGPAFFSPRTRYLPLATNVVPFDSHVDPDFPAEAPRARGLVDEGSPFVDNDFRTGYRFRALPASRPQHRTYEIGGRGRLRAGYIYDPLFSGAEPVSYGGRSAINHYVISSPRRYTYEVAPPTYIIG
ncbi:unnamed protein product [Cylicocyclus nassatus]|uniref:Uncharacterized protein n=1 Tax=Cylicocyclus nassatus TaxID=53992 RepID=A0AA36H9D3_CYLNA|nr:unnamed protein product [Cylicocyclus nassatus]